jgi:hypothetical protein
MSCINKISHNVLIVIHQPFICHIVEFINQFIQCFLNFFTHTRGVTIEFSCIRNQLVVDQCNNNTKKAYSIFAEERKWKFRLSDVMLCWKLCLSVVFMYRTFVILSCWTVLSFCPFEHFVYLNRLSFWTFVVMSCRTILSCEILLSF